jgi:hypothetical protein
MFQGTARKRLLFSILTEIADGVKCGNVEGKRKRNMNMKRLGALRYDESAGRIG